ncbi:hypothetical protein ACFY1P_20165 [Streptomyces sp. NPDC001407]|uniref:hypothetical protein n=1 Tax=Streptomyces sp. NPDC001407 TaxID=3364573 RepID=UPI0036C32FE1
MSTAGWTFHLSPHTLDQITGLPEDARSAALDLVDRLEADPYRHSVPFGQDDGMTREASFGSWGTMVVLCNPLTRRITMLAVAWTG